MCFTRALPALGLVVSCKSRRSRAAIRQRAKTQAERRKEVPSRSRAVCGDVSRRGPGSASRRDQIRKGPAAWRGLESCARLSALSAKERSAAGAPMHQSQLIALAPNPRRVGTGPRGLPVFSITTPPPAGGVQALPRAALATDTNATNEKARHNGRAFFGVLLHTMGKRYANARHGVKPPPSPLQSPAPPAPAPAGRCR